MVDEQNLRQLAEAATPGVWNANGFSVNSKEHGWSAIANTEFDYDGMAENAAFIAASNPAAILSLLDEIDRLKAENAGLHKSLLQAVYYLKQGKAQFAPSTTNSDVDTFLERFAAKGDSHG